MPMLRSCAHRGVVLLMAIVAMGAMAVSVAQADQLTDSKGKKHYSMYCEGGEYNEKGTGLRKAGTEKTG